MRGLTGDASSAILYSVGGTHQPIGRCNVEKQWEEPISMVELRSLLVARAGDTRPSV